MARIEELPSAFDDALNLNVPPTTTTTNTTTPSTSNETPFGIKPNGLTTSDPTAPSLPPSMASVKSHSAAEIQAMLNQTPLFMTDVAAAAQQDEGGGEGGENMFLEAIRALQHEGTQLEVARGFRETGNELAREKKWGDAREFYDKALATVRVKEGGQVAWDVSADPEGDREAMREVEEKVLVNRALCNLEMKNYRSCTLDCAAALQLNPRNLKAYYRTARALLALDKTPAARDAAHRGLALDPANAALQQLAPRIAARHAALEQDAARRRAADAHAARIARTLATALRARGIRTRSSAASQQQQPELEDAAMHLAPDPEAADSTLVVPCVVLYPAHAQSDVIKAFAETDCVREHLAYLLPAPWDREGEYTVDGVECFMETAAGGLVRVGKDVSLLEVLSGGGAVVEIVDGLVTMHVLPAARSARWIEELKARRSVRG
ncbi:HSP70/90 co-chaperone [Ophidiomyces ophidiicola]|nr:HSP70/90 co-chaperone [Ophidiomyces ophidiicola]